MCSALAMRVVCSTVLTFLEWQTSDVIIMKMLESDVVTLIVSVEYN